MRTLKTGIAILLATFAVGANAQGYAYGIDSTNQLYRVDLSNASSNLIGTVQANGAIYECLGMDPTGTLYGITSYGDLFQINTSNAFGTWIANTGIGNCEGMDWDAASGRMLISDFSTTPNVYSINLSTAVPTLLQTASKGGSVIRTLATRTSSSVLDVRYDVGLQGDIQGTFDMSSGATANVGTATPMGILGMDYGLNGALYGLTSTGDLVLINPGTGAFSTVGTAAAGAYFLGMATDVVPEPGSMLVLALGLGAVARRRRK